MTARGYGDKRLPYDPIYPTHASHFLASFPRAGMR